MLYRVVAADAFSTQRQFLWDLCYRATGSAADADMLLRECFSRALLDRPLRPHVDRETDWRPHLTRSAAQLAIDTLRRRKHRTYAGCWLPSPVETGSSVSRGPRSANPSGGPRYDAVESGSMAFLMALEALDTRERVVFLMCDAFGVDTFETATTLDLTTATVRASLQQARGKMQAYDAAHDAPTADVQGRTAGVLRHCLSSLQRHDAGSLESMLAPDAQLCFDGGGEFVAPLAAVGGPARIARLLIRFAEGVDPTRFGFRMLNGLPAAVGVSPGRARWPRRFVFRIEARGELVTAVQVIMASAKLTAVRFDPV